MLFGDGFMVTPEEAKILGLGKIHGLEKHIRPYRNGIDLVDRPREVLVIDFLDLPPTKLNVGFQPSSNISSERLSRNVIKTEKMRYEKIGGCLVARARNCGPL